MGKRFLRLPEVLSRIPVSKSTFWNGVREGRFPRPVKLTIRTSAWEEDKIDDLCEKIAASGRQAARQ